MFSIFSGIGRRRITTLEMVCIACVAAVVLPSLVPAYQSICDYAAQLAHEARFKAIEGDVYYEGEVLPRGVVQFARYGEIGEEVQMEVKNGQFKGKLLPGEYLMSVKGLRAIPGKKGPSGEAVLEQYLPPYLAINGPRFVVKADGDRVELDLLAKDLPADVLESDPQAYEKLCQRNQAKRARRLKLRSPN